MAWPPTADEVRDLLRITAPQSGLDSNVLGRALDAAVEYVHEVRADLFAPVGDPPTPPPDPSANVHYGTTMLAAHWYTNRMATTGADPISDLGPGPATYVPANIQRMLGIGSYARPRVG